MSIIKVAGKTFELAKVWKRFAALVIDVAFLLFISYCGLAALCFLVPSVVNAIVPRDLAYIEMYPLTTTLMIWTIDLNPYPYLIQINPYGFPLLGLCILGLLFIDGYKNGQSPGKNALKIQVRSLKEGQPCGFKDALIRRSIGIFQPFDVLHIFGGKRQRLGDKVAKTVVVEEVWVELEPVPEKSVHIAGKTFELADRLTRVFALALDALILAVATFGLVYLFIATAPGWQHATYAEAPNFYFLAFTSYGTVPPHWKTLDFLTICLWIFGLFLMDGFNGQSIGKRVAGIQARRLKDGRPCGFKDAFIRRFIGIFQPFDVLHIFGKKRRRLGDKFAGTVVVKQVAEELVQIVSEDRVPQPAHVEAELKAVLDKMENEMSIAKEKVTAAINAEKQFQNEHDKNVARASEYYQDAADALKRDNEDLAREALKRRDECLRLAAQQKKQWEEQQQSVEDFNDVLTSLQHEMLAAEVRGRVVSAQHKNVEAETHLREALKEMQSSQALEKIVDLEQEVIEDVILAKAMAEADQITDQDAVLEREFLDYAEERSIDEELAVLQAAIDKRK